MGSWKIICILVRRCFVSFAPKAPEISTPSKVTVPEVGVYSRMMERPMVDLPEPDSPTSP